MAESLYQDIVAAGIPHNSHESDLYFKKTDQSMEILKKYPECEKSARSFVNRLNKEVWIDTPFAFEPWWIERCGRS